MNPTDRIEQQSYPFGTRKRNKSPPTVQHTPESAVLNACIRWLYAHGIFCHRNNSGAYKPEGSKHFIRYGYPGSPDIIGVMPISSLCPGKFLGIEAKSANGRLQESQTIYRDKILAAQGIYLVARSVDDLELHLLPLLRGP